MPTKTTDADTDVLHDFEEMRPLGILYLINKAVFHPRGFALSLSYSDDGELLGWQMLGDGTEAWRMSADQENDLFPAVEAFLNSLRPDEV
mgnify:CR=1 FL=1